MRKPGAAAFAAMIALALAGQAQAASNCLTGAALDAAKLRQLDVMLLVSSLRCRKGVDDFRAEYDSFLLRNRAELGVANRRILSELSPRLGARGAMDALDRMSVSLANRYGQDSATASCSELKQTAAALGAPHDAGALVAAADYLIGDDVDTVACAIRYAAR